MIGVRFPAMSTEVEAWCDEGGLPALRAWFEFVEARCSRFRPESELSRLNREQTSEVHVTGILLDAIRAGSRARRLTGGLVDIGVGSAVKAWGYDRSFEDVSDLDHPPANLTRSDWRLDGAVLIRPAEVQIDLGGIGKGWAADRAVMDGLATVVSVGGDLRSGHPDTTATVTDVANEVVARVQVGIGALATSSVGKRRWRVAGTEVNHVIDPRTMRPVETPVLSATVLADTAADAEAGAKAVLVLGTEGLAWAAEQRWITAALIIWHDGSVYGTPGLEMAA